MSLPFLEKIGLTVTEATLYELLLRLGDVSAGRLIAETSLKRATTYKALYSLEKKHLVSQVGTGKIIHFRPEPPTTLLELAEEKQNMYERARKDLQALLPQLTSFYILAVEKPVVTTFEGVDGLKEIYNDMLREAKPIYAILQTHEVDPTLYKWLTGPFVRRRSKLKIPVEAIVSSSKATGIYVEQDQKEFRKTTTVPSEQFPFQQELDIYGNKVAFVNFIKGESLIGILINHPQIAKTMKAIFDLSWHGAGVLSSH